MKRCICTFIGFVISLTLLSGCRLLSDLPKYIPKYIPFMYVNSEAIADEVGEKIMDAIQSQDVEALKELFSPGAQESIPNFSDLAEEFIHLFKGEIVSYELEPLNSYFTTSHGIKHWSTFGRCYVTTNESKYSFAFIVYFRYSDDADMEGLHFIKAMEDLVLHGKGIRTFPKYDDNTGPGIEFQEYE